MKKWLFVNNHIFKKLILIQIFCTDLYGFKYFYLILIIFNHMYLPVDGTLRFGLVSLFNGISTLCRLFNAKAILLEEQ